MTKLNIKVESLTGDQSKNVEVTDLVIAGWAGRDQASMEHHIRELEELGIARPKATPTFYRVSATRLSTDNQIEVMGEHSSGEVECVLLAADKKLYVGLGSDHTDRKVEAYGVTASKQICEKPVSRTFWPLEDVISHWDDLCFVSYATVAGERVLYQQGSVSMLLNPLDLVRKYAGSENLSDGTVMFCGTLPAIGGVRPGEDFECLLVDPVLSRELKLSYTVKSLAIAD